ncbi:uncharacterized protein UBRO_20723 [Ustilago bromivora]|uniref:Uncharacterized protein n=1 Tax=Ustilago bromivora TaxID=307758 RepID=A0A1K0G5Z6_9BASI|nr:uncharacterized protein UBRO_20723 [Ustilago bromivora]
MPCQGRLGCALLVLNLICLTLTLYVPPLGWVHAESLNNFNNFFLREGWAKEFRNNVWTIVMACKCMGDNACLDSSCCHLSAVARLKPDICGKSQLQLISARSIVKAFYYYSCWNLL